MADRYVCIHGHFYQPPRENAWLETVEMQDSASPYHDWNERVADECYGPNARSRVLDAEGWIVDISSNYSSISFDYGPTLLAWLKYLSPEVYRRMIQADKDSMAQFSGHGSASAQGYNHAILPLCNDRDRVTQVRWGIRDFVSRFGRQPEGMWLPETAVNTATLETIVEHGIRFTVLAPRQAARIRPVTDEKDAPWEDVSGARIDPSRAYLCRLPSGQSIALFFYDGPVSQAIAFEGLLQSGERLAHRLFDAFNDARSWPQLAHVATDGETYGHHRAQGNIALAAAIKLLRERNDVALTNYSEFLANHPPTHEVQIVENSAWSCAHGVERWRSDCACSSGMHMNWHQRWRGPLREAFDWLRDSVAPLYERVAATLLKDPWAARDAYIDVLLDRCDDSLNLFFEAHQRHPLTDDGRRLATQLLELQRHAMLMYTSCGWFFDDVSGLETIQVIQYGGRVIQLAREALVTDLEEPFLSRLERAEGNTPSLPDGRAVYLHHVKRAMVDLSRVAAHYAISSLFEEYPEKAKLFCYDVTRQDAVVRSAGRSRLLLGRAHVTSRITLESAAVSYGVLHLGDQALSCGVKREYGEPAPPSNPSGAPAESAFDYAKLLEEATSAFDRADFADVLRILDQRFSSARYSIASLFRDEQHKVVRRILEPTLAQIDAAYQQVYEQHAPLVRFLRQMDLTVPRRLQFPATFVLNQALARALSSDRLDTARILQLIEEAKTQGVPLEERNLAFAIEGTLDRMISPIGESSSPDDLLAVRKAVELARSLPFTIDFWQIQDKYWDRRNVLLPVLRTHAEAGDPVAGRWIEEFMQLGGALRVRVA